MDYTIQKFNTPPLVIVKVFASTDEYNVSKIFANLVESLQKYRGEECLYLLFDLRNIPDSFTTLIENFINTSLSYHTLWEVNKNLNCWIVATDSLIPTIETLIPSESTSLSVVNDYTVAIDSIDTLFAGQDEYKGFKPNS